MYTKHVFLSFFCLEKLARMTVGASKVKEAWGMPSRLGTQDKVNLQA